MNKKGSHVGVVVSFVIFVTFLIFLYTMLQPITVKERGREYILDYLTLNLLGEATGNLTTMVIHIDEEVNPPFTCVQLQNFNQHLDRSLWGNLLFNDPDGNEITYEERNNKIYVNTGTGFSGILTVYYSENIIGEQESMSPCSPHETNVGYIRSFSELFGTKMYELKDEYDLNYEGLKAHLGIPEGTEFNFYVLDGARKPIISAEMYKIPTDRSVYVEETPIQYLNEDGNMIFGFLLVKIW